MSTRRVRDRRERMAHFCTESCEVRNKFVSINPIPDRFRAEARRIDDVRCYISIRRVLEKVVDRFLTFAPEILLRPREKHLSANRDRDTGRGTGSAHVILEPPPDLNDESHANLDTSFHQVLPDRNLPAFDPVRSHESSSKLALHPLEIGFYFGDRKSVV